MGLRQIAAASVAPAMAITGLLALHVLVQTAGAALGEAWPDEPLVESEAADRSVDLGTQWTCGDCAAAAILVVPDTDGVVPPAVLESAPDAAVLAYDPTDGLAAIGPDAAADMEAWIEQHPSEELVVLGLGAGGLVALQAVQEAGASDVTVHTVGTPLSGYGEWSQYVGADVPGLVGDVVDGLPPWPEVEASVVHHKAVDDDALRSECGGFAQFCDPYIVQDNDVPGAEVYWYQDGHDALVDHVANAVLDPDT